MTTLEATPLAAPGTYPVPTGRGRWRFTLHRRAFSAQVYPTDTGISELVTARSRKLELAWDTPATLTFTVDGHSPTAAAISELTQDVIGWRWDDQTGADIPMFRGIIAQSEDQLTTESHTVTFTCHDYLAMLARRYITQPTPYIANYDQDNLAANLIQLAVAASSGGTPGIPASVVSFSPASFLPILAHNVNPDGSDRSTASGQTRARTYFGGTQISQVFDDLAKVVNGFEYDVLPRSDVNGIDYVRIFYPSQGVARSDVVLMYGATVSGLTRTVNSAGYANYWRVLGNNASSDPSTAQLYADVWNEQATLPFPGAGSVGLWMSAESGAGAADVTTQATLTQQAQGDLGRTGLLVPAYTLTLRPGAYVYGRPNMGDTVPLIVQSGRLNVNTTVRVLGITFDVGDDGNEDVTLTVGAPPPPAALSDLFAQSFADLAALARR
jgi:hypothetical protein